MIQLSRLESGLIQLQLEEKSLNQTVLMAIKNVFAKAKQHHITLTYDSEKELSLMHDQRWTAEAIFNLLDNAVKYSHPAVRLQFEFGNWVCLLRWM